MRSLNLLESPESGTIEINGVKVIAPDIKKQDAFALRQQTAMVFQHYNLFRNKTVLENVTLSLISNNVMKKDEAAEFGEKLLIQVGLSKQKKPIPSDFIRWTTTTGKYCPGSCCTTQSNFTR